MKRCLLLISLFIFFPNSGNAQSTGDIDTLDERIKKLENLVHSDPFIYDLALRERIDKSISKQENLDKMIDILRNELDKISDSVQDINKNKGVEIDRKLADIKAEFLYIFEIAKSLQQENAQSIKDTNKAAIDAASKSAENANKRFENFINSLIVIATLLTIVSGVFGYLFVKSYSKVKESKELYSSMKMSLDSELESLTVIKRELMTLHKMLDLRENFKSYKARGYKAEYLQEVVYNEAKELLKELDDIQSEHKNGYEKEIEANISYSAALLGVVSYHKQKHLDAYQYFIRAEQTNRHNHSDRIFNLGCLAAKLYQETANNEYLSKVIDNYIKLFKYNGEAILFREDRDIKPIIDDIDKELKERGLDKYILPATI
mgnify:CR=1 FL=1